MADAIPTKPDFVLPDSVNGWNDYVARQIAHKVDKVNEFLDQIASLEADMIPGGDSEAQDVAHSHIKFAERIKRDWQMHGVVAQSAAKAKRAPKPKPFIPPIPLPNGST
jgi:hypothetical protein